MIHRTASRASPLHRTDYVAARGVIMMQPEHIFIRVGNRVPFSYHQIGQPLFVPAINERSVDKWTRAQSVEITNLSSPGIWREYFTPRFVTITMKDGRTYDVPVPLIPEGLNGGGWFIEAELNPIYSEPAPFDKYQARLRARQEADALELAMDW